MIESIRRALRIKTDSHDEEIERYITYVKMDLIYHGMSRDSYDESDPLIITLTEIYCKVMFEFDGKQDWYMNQYNLRRDNIVCMERYRGN